MLENLIVFLVVGMIISSAVYKIYKDKKKGGGCASCPYNTSCSGGIQNTGECDIK
ncbi:FeoB-associated Cys-rich membrane protein [Alkalibacter mobilis]|uniref:FeoB-associated Cys-rich membrane protein n=1 Tax=Alkalibacter mobilis TaxID=2787712 RepID=UPI00189CEFE9|nr:FeoB-associated Cys-rich membrane protein [Alkalibacter mobilis]MBF7096804.1 FeoB-associated Cys-rich membrane protein [Alkalibacter mobilis]